jgi:hypothetical protein
MSKEWASRVGNLGREKIPRKAGRRACCETRGAKHGVRKALSACWRSPLRRLVGRLISNRWGGEGRQFTEAFMEGGVGTVAQEWRDLRVR